MRYSSTLITPPSSEPVTVADVKAWARISSDDEDVLLGSLIIAARQEAEKYLKRALITQTWEYTLDNIPSYFDSIIGDGVYELPVNVLYEGLPKSITLPYAPIQSITSVTTYNLENTGTVYSSDNYTLDVAGSRLVLDYSAIWPSDLRNKASLVIRYVAGYGSASAVPQAIKIAIMSYVQEVYESRGICDVVSDPIQSMQTRLALYRNMTCA